MTIAQGRIIEILTSELTVLKELHELLCKEHSALKNKDNDLVDKYNLSKSALLKQLDELEIKRQQCVTNNPERTGLERTLTAEQQELESKINHYLDQCKHQNRINGSIIEISLLFSHRIMDIFKGNITNGETYGASGKNENKNAPHRIAQV